MAVRTASVDKNAEITLLSPYLLQMPFCGLTLFGRIVDLLYGPKERPSRVWL